MNGFFFNPFSKPVLSSAEFREGRQKRALSPLSPLAWERGWG
jgi:hypothetical protein